MIYLDNASTTRMWHDVLLEMQPYLEDKILMGNPYSEHSAGKIARDAVEKARERVANLIHTTPDHIIFTSGATEANNMVLASFSPENIVSTEQEHDSVYRRAITHGTMIKPKNGRVDLAGIKKVSAENECSLYSIMFTNNETGMDNPVWEITREINCGSLIHTDATQAIMSHDINVEELGVDYMTFSSHKIHGPKGVGCLYARNPCNLFGKALIKGGVSQEYGLRGGTPPVHDIVGFGKACEILKRRRDEFSQLAHLKKIFSDYIKWALGSRFHVNFWGGSSGILSVRVDGVDAETLCMTADLNGLCISSGSACHSGRIDPSRALLFAGLTPEEARSTVRISFALDSTEDDAKYGASAFILSVKQLDKF